MENVYDTYWDLLNEIRQRNGLDWELMSNSDRALLKVIVQQILRDYCELAYKIEQWENVHGKVETDTILN